MIALDTNVVLRFLVRDDEAQARVAYSRLKRAEAARETLFVPLLVVLETLWVLESAYGLARDEILVCLEEMMVVPVLRFEAHDVVRALVSSARRHNTDLSDILIALSAEASGCDSVLTFDRKACRFPIFTLAT